MDLISAPVIIIGKFLGIINKKTGCGTSSGCFGPKGDYYTFMGEMLSPQLGAYLGFFSALIFISARAWMREDVFEVKIQMLSEFGKAVLVYVISSFVFLLILKQVSQPPIY